MEKSRRKILRNNIQLMKQGFPQWGFCMFGVSLYALFIYALGLFLGLFMTRTINLVQAKLNPVNDLISLVLELALLTILAYTGYIINAYWGFKIRSNIQERLLSSLLHKPDNVDTVHSSDYMTTFTTDMNVVENFFFQGFLFTFLQPVVSGIAASLTLYFIDQTVFVAAVLIGFFTVLLTVVASKRLQQISNQAKKEELSLNLYCEESVYGNATYRMMRCTADVFDDFVDVSKRYKNIKVEEYNLQLALENTSKLGAVLSVGVFLSLGIVSAQRGEIEFSNILIAMNLQNTISQMFLGISSAWEYMASISVSAERVTNLIKCPKETFLEESHLHKTGSVRCLKVEKLSYGYTEEKPLVRDLSFTLIPGSYSVLVGASGSGKTSLLRTIMRLIDPCSGDMQINDISFRQCSTNQWRKYFAYVPQDVHFVRRSVADNIALGDSEKDPENSIAAIVESAQRAGAHDFINDLPNGYDTIIEEDGKNLSVGQRQRIGIARALYSAAPILILDEPTSALDAESERKIYEAIRSYAVNHLVLIASHNKNFVNGAAQVIDLEKFQTIE